MRTLEANTKGAGAIFISCLFCVLVFIGSCSPRIIEHTIIQRDTTYIEKTQIDSIFQKDSVYIREKGDTLYIYKEKIRDRYKYIHDTCYVTKVDSVLKEREKVIEVEKPLPKWKTFQLSAFWWVCCCLVISLLWIFRKPIIAIIKSLLKL